MKDRVLQTSRLVARCWAGLVEDEVSLRASSLAYSVLFCAAPIFALLLGLSSMFPKAFSFLPRLYAEIGPRVLPSVLNEAALSLRIYADNATHLSLASFALFVVSALLLSMQLERCVQSAWGIPFDPTRISNPFARHWLALTLTPCAMAFIGWIVYEALTLAPEAEVSWGASLGIIFGLFLIASWALPSTRPPFGIAVFASGLASLECLGLQSGFSYAWTLSQSYGVMYGAAAVFLGALLWIWTFWLCLLSSISITSTLFLGRPRDLTSNGLGFVESFLRFFEPPRTLPPPRIRLPEALELQVLDKLGADTSFCDPLVYGLAQTDSSSLATRRAALGEACASRAAQVMITDAISSPSLDAPPIEPFPISPPLGKP